MIGLVVLPAFTAPSFRINVGDIFAIVTDPNFYFFYWTVTESAFCLVTIRADLAF
jgi:hypothetical protein